jgi:transposase
MDQRTQFIADSQREVFTVVELADRYQISRKTAYKWMDRYEQGGPPALLDRSRRPKSCPHESRPEIVEAILDVRRHHPTCVKFRP